MTMDLIKDVDEALKELGIQDYRCTQCSVEYSAEEPEVCPKCGSEEIEEL